MTGIVELFLQFEAVRLNATEILSLLIARTRAEGALISVPKGRGSDFLVWPWIPGDLPLGEHSMTINNSFPCKTVIENNSPVGVEDIHLLSRNETCSFMLAEEFTAILGAPVRVEGEAEPAGVLAVVSRTERSWSDADKCQVAVAAGKFSDLLSGKTPLDQRVH